MKLRFRAPILFALLALALFAPRLAYAQAGRFLMAIGDVVVARGAQQVPAAPGTAVEAGDTIRLGANSNAQVRMTDESIVSLRQNTVFRIDEYVYSGAIDGREKTVFTLLRGGLRTITGAIGRLHSRDKYQVRTATSTIGIRGTHYVVVHCADDCVEPRRVSVAALDLAQAGGIGGAAGPNGTFGGVSDGRIDVSNNGANSTTRDFGANEYFRVASPDTPPQGLIAPPGFLYDRLSGQARRTGNAGSETPPSGGADNDSRSSELPPVLSPVGPLIISEPPREQTQPKPTIGIVGGWRSADGSAGDGGAFVTPSMLTLSGTGTSQTLTGFNIPGSASPAPLSDEPSGISGVALGSITQQGGADPGDGSINANWGVWNSGTINENSGPTSFPAGAHYMFGNLAPAEVVAAKSGIFTLNEVNGTNPTSTLGPGSGTYPTLTLNFTARTVAVGAFSWGFSGGTMSMAPTTGTIAVIPGQGAGIDAVGSLSCLGGCASTGDYGMTGVFLGPKGDHLATVIGAQAGTATAHGTRLYSCAPSC